jgi:hypothetical protein
VSECDLPNTLMQWYQAIDPISPFYAKANLRLYHLYLTYSENLLSQDIKTHLFQFAFRSGDSELIDKAFSLLCDLGLHTQFKSVQGEEANLVEMAHYIHSLNQQIKVLKAENEKLKIPYDVSFFATTTATSMGI